MQHAENYRVTRIFVEEADHDFIADLGTEEKSPFLACVQAGHASPDTFVILTDNRQADPYAVLAVRIFVAHHDTDLKAGNAGEQGACRGGRHVVGRQLVESAELHVRFPALHQIEFMAHAADENLAVEAGADSGEHDDITRLERTDAFALAATADLVDAGAQPFTIGPSLRLGFDEGGMAQFQRFGCGHGRKIVTGKIARPGESGRIAVDFEQALLGRVPTDAAHGRELCARIDFGIELQQRRTELQGATRRRIDGRLADDDLVAGGPYQQAVGMSAGEHEVPVAGVKLHQLLVFERCCRYLADQAGLAKKRFDHLAVGLVEVARIAAPHSHLHRRMATVDDQLRRTGVANLHVQPHDDSLEQRVLTTAGTGEDFDALAGLEQIAVAEREVAAGSISVQIHQTRRGDTVDHQTDAYCQQLVFARHRLILHLDGEFAMRSGNRQGACFRHHFSSGGKKILMPGRMLRKSSIPFAWATRR